MKEKPQDVFVTGKCPICKKTKEYKMPITFTPRCDTCFFPMVMKKLTIKNYGDE